MRTAAAASNGRRHLELAPVKKFQKFCSTTRCGVRVCVYTQSMTTTAATTYTATLPNGKTVTRKSKRTYTHFYAKKMKPEITDTAAVKNVGTDWFFGGFSSSQAHAQKAAAATSWGMFDWVVLEVSAQP